jgi:hypothetical protein
MTESQEEKLTDLVKQFIDQKLDGRYLVHVSDAFLAALMVRSCAPKVKEILEGDPNEAYSGVCYIFENILEHKCRAGGNGHHVAQSFQIFANNWVANAVPA